MDMRYWKVLGLLIGIGCVVQAAWAQSVQVTLGPEEISENQGWTITITVQNDRLRSFDPFPDIEGFRKRGTSTQSITNYINGQGSSTHSLIMTYLPLRQGVITVPGFTMKVNDISVTVPGKRVKVGPPTRQQPSRSFFDDDFGRRDVEYIDVEADAFVALTTSKDEVYEGEGFNVTISFFVSNQNRAQLSFHKIGAQLADILKKVKPNNCWEEDFQIESIEPERVTLNGKGYSQWKLYQATFYPLNTNPVQFPSFNLEMIKYKVAKNPTFFGANSQEGFETFTSKPKTVKVKPLPPHPLRGSVAVGKYQLDERIRSTQIETGASTPYEFNITGVGNISAITKPFVSGGDVFEIYDPNVRQNITRAQGRVSGTKTFSYYIIPKEPGDFNLGDYFQWIYFNTESKRYDTLRSKIQIAVTGESRKNEYIEANDMGEFYDKIQSVDNTLVKRKRNDWQRWVFGGFIMLTLVLSGFLFFRKS
jgi:hypothetical protein